MTRPAHAIIDLDAIRHNYAQAKALAPDSQAIAIIKANAYGHGAVAVGKALSDQAHAFGVACLEEALELRESGISNPILLLEGVFEPDELQLVDRHHLDIAVATPQQLQWLLDARPAHAIKVFLKMDSGMHRLGFAPEAIASAYQQLAGCKHVQQVVMMTHFASADNDATVTEQQVQRFKQATQAIHVPQTLSNSAGIIGKASSHQHYVRPGIMLYGATPMGTTHASHDLLKPAMSLRSAIFSIRDLPAGECIGYSGRFLCERPTRVGVVAMGYADGYPRHAIDGTPVWIDGQMSRIIGRVSMDMLTVDLTDLPHITEGAPVELWGNHVAANLVADHCDTIAYTLFTGITRRVPLRYINQ
ncbi:MAG: alanine racemase [Proteobacteria bacterium]|nr:MAG: alanine racemase [Pseudomonadota bacterium]